MDFKIDLLGKTGNPKFNDNHKIDYLNLVKPLEWENGVCKIVCNQCKTIQEISFNYANRLIQVLYILQKPLPKEFKTKEDFKNWYFVLPYCDYCKKNNKIAELEIKKITRPN
ncbi:hypothetical protein K9M50_00710 [Patescibacteria group bacterium]|nr:hypothetical protein [Patescibacteria group bacterium]